MSYGLHLIGNPAGTYHFVGSVPVPLNLESWTTVTAAIDAMVTAGHGGRLCTSEHCACRSLFTYDPGSSLLNKPGDSVKRTVNDEEYAAHLASHEPASDQVPLIDHYPAYPGMNEPDLNLLVDALRAWHRVAILDGPGTPQSSRRDGREAGKAQGVDHSRGDELMARRSPHKLVAKIQTVPNGSNWTCAGCDVRLTPGSQVVRRGSERICTPCIRGER